jgi:uncharacterized protein (DUF427 family)
MHWKYNGRIRPPFAAAAGAGQESVWDYPRPPLIVEDTRRVLVMVDDTLIVETDAALRVLETASPPTFYVPLADVRTELLVWRDGGSVCEWKGVASYCDVVLPELRVADAGWRYADPRPQFARIAERMSFYPGRVECYVAGERVLPQPGGFYGGWLTHEIVGPIKGAPGTAQW